MVFWDLIPWWYYIWTLWENDIRIDGTSGRMHDTHASTGFFWGCSSVLLSRDRGAHRATTRGPDKLRKTAEFHHLKTQNSGKSSASEARKRSKASELLTCSPSKQSGCRYFNYRSQKGGTRSSEHGHPRAVTLKYTRNQSIRQSCLSRLCRVPVSWSLLYNSPKGSMYLDSRYLGLKVPV